MRKYRRRLVKLLTHSSIFAATVFGALYAQAATLGHSRVVSASTEPLRIVVQLKGLSVTDLQSVSAQIAPKKAWQEAGLIPPVELSSLSTHLLPGHQEQVMQLVIQSNLVSSATVLDVLIDVNTASSTQRHQVSVLQAQKGIPGAPVRLAATTPRVTPTNQTSPVSVTAPPATEQAQTLKVKKGQHLYGIARTFQGKDYSDQQLMAALVQTNPEAFIQGNMNLLRAGATLTIPSGETITAISPQQAHHFYQEQLKQFDEYRQRIAKGEPPTTTPAPSETQKMETEEVKPNTDRLQLSAQTDSDAKKDQKTATAQELAYTAERLGQLESAQKVPDQTVNGSAATQSDSVNNAVSPAVEPTPITNTVAPSTTSAVITTNSEAITNATVTNSVPATLAWWKSNAVVVGVGLFLLLVGLIAWLLRRAHSTRMEYAEMVASNSVRTREKADPDEVEFREIK